MNKKILITGASGFIGKTLLEFLIQDPKNEITITSRSSKDLLKLKKKHPSITIISGDLMDISFVNLIVKNKDLIYHLAGYKFVNLSESNIMDSVNGNIILTHNILNAASLLKNNITVKIISTNKALNIKSIYGATKFITERLAKGYDKKNKNINVEIIYLTNIFKSPGSIGEIWKSKILNDQEIIITDPNCTRYFLTSKQAVLLIENKKFDLDLIKSIRLSDLVQALILKYNSKYKKDLIKIVGLTESEELHECHPIKVQSSDLNYRYNIEEICENV